MLKKLHVWGLTNLAALLVFVASSGFGTNSVGKGYEPNMPECLKR